MSALVSTSPADIVNAARCFISCVPVSQRLALKTYLLTQFGNAATPPCVIPTAPTSAGAKSIGNTTIVMSWSQPPNAGSFIKNYIVYWGTVSGVYTNNSGLLPAMPRLYTISGLSTGTTYFWAVQAVAFSGCNSAVSAEKSATTTGAAPACTSPILTDWLARVALNGGAVPSAATQQAVCNFANGLVTDGLDGKMLVWNAFVPDSLIAAFTPQLTNIASFGGNDPWTNNNFVLGDLTVNGLTGNASNKFLATGFATPGAFNTSFGVVVYDYLANATGDDYGAYNGASGIIGASKYADGNTYSFMGSIANNAIVLASPGNGFYSSQRVSTTDHRIYFATSVSPHAQIGATDVVNSGALPGAVNFTIFGASLTGAIQSPSSNTLSFFAFTSGLSAADSAKLYARVQALRVALGGGFR